MSDSLRQVEVGRLAMRVEGNYWIAYHAPMHTMEGAIVLGSIAMGAVANNPDRKRAFMDLMRDFVDDIVADAIGASPAWGDMEPTPEHERSGSA